MKKKKLTAVNKRARQLQEHAEKPDEPDVFGMGEDVMTGMPIGCTTIFDTGWETNPRPETPMGNCVSSARDWTSCSGPCWWPAQTPDNITNHPDFQNQCRAIEKDWRNLNFVIKK
jgi:hypothetical protein